MSLVKNNTENYSLSVIGDVNQDGELNALDLTRLIKHIIGARNFQITDTPRLKAGDLTGDGNINVSALTRMIKCIITSRLPEDPNPGGDNAKQNVNLSLSEISGQTTYPNIKTVEITKSADVELSVTSSNENVATANITGTTLTITPVGAGTSVITVTSAETNEYNSASVQYIIEVARGDGNITLSEYSGTTAYPNNKTITISNVKGGNVTVSSSNSSIATASINGSTITIVPKTSGTTVISITSAQNDKYLSTTVAYTITVEKGEGNIVLSEMYGETTYPTAKTITVRSHTGTTISASSSNESVATVSTSGNTIIINPVKVGTAVISVTSSGSSIYDDCYATYAINVKRGTKAITVRKTAGPDVLNINETATFVVSGFEDRRVRSYSNNSSIFEKTTGEYSTTITIVGKKTGTANMVVEALQSDCYEKSTITIPIKVLNRKDLIKNGVVMMNYIERWGGMHQGLDFQFSHDNGLTCCMTENSDLSVPYFNFDLDPETNVGAEYKKVHVNGYLSITNPNRNTYDSGYPIKFSFTNDGNWIYNEYGYSDIKIFNLSDSYPINGTINFCFSGWVGQDAKIELHIDDMYVTDEE